MKLKLFILMTALFTSLVCQAKEKDSELGYKLVQKGALLLDVRTPEEYQSRHLEGARLIPLQEIPSRLSEIQKLLGGDKTKPIVVHCKSGRRASEAQDLLLQNGFTNVTNLGGIDDWPKKN